MSWTIGLASVCASVHRNGVDNSQEFRRRGVGKRREALPLRMEFMCCTKWLLQVSEVIMPSWPLGTLSVGIKQNYVLGICCLKAVINVYCFTQELGWFWLEISIEVVVRSKEVSTIRNLDELKALLLRPHSQGWKADAGYWKEVSVLCHRVVFIGLFECFMAWQLASPTVNGSKASKVEPTIFFMT